MSVIKVNVQYLTHLVKELIELEILNATSDDKYVDDRILILKRMRDARGVLAEYLKPCPENKV